MPKCEECGNLVDCYLDDQGKAHKEQEYEDDDTKKGPKYTFSSQYGPYKFPPLNKTYKALCVICYTAVLDKARAAHKTDMRDIKTRRAN